MLYENWLFGFKKETNLIICWVKKEKKGNDSTAHFKNITLEGDILHFSTCSTEYLIIPVKPEDIHSSSGET